MGVGAARTACPRFEGRWTAGFRGFVVAARARDVPFVTCSTARLAFERSREKGVKSSVNVKVR
jgi:hypothetical protein